MSRSRASLPRFAAAAFLLYITGVFIVCLYRRSLKPAVFINEVCSSNFSSLSDNVALSGESVTYPDWLELYNGEDRPVDLEGFHLEVGSRKREWTFPAGTIAPGGYAIVFLSSDYQADDRSIDLDAPLDLKSFIFTGRLGYTDNAASPLSGVFGDISDNTASHRNAALSHSDNFSGSTDVFFMQT